MKKLFLCMCIGIQVNLNVAFAQVNLVPNPSFEVYDTCPSANETLYQGINHAIPWFQPCVQGVSTDYFNSCNLDTSQSAGTPLNYEGFQVAKTGVAYAGFITGIVIPPNNYREYLEVRLSDTLLSGKKYCVSFYVSFANISQRATDGLAAYFSTNMVTSQSLNLLLFQPQVQNPSGNVITDTLNWVEISGSFYAAGGERYITIGNFRADSNTTMIQNNYGLHGYSYYYIDDVSVVYCDSDVGINENEWVNNFTISPNPAQNTISLNNLPKQLSTILIYDEQGKIILRENNISVLQNMHTINIFNLSSGVYFVKVVTKDGIVTRKIMKE